MGWLTTDNFDIHKQISLQRPPFSNKNNSPVELIDEFQKNPTISLFLIGIKLGWGDLFMSRLSASKSRLSPESKKRYKTSQSGIP
ncbi:hypothetical protein AM228_08975 [Planktothricoides sp. SR001]|nr:hypothetical protein AM228_08975 [Planktothricoides sp. SR001]